MTKDSEYFETRPAHHRAPKTSIPITIRRQDERSKAPIDEGAVARFFEGAGESKQFTHALTWRYATDDSSSIEIDEHAAQWLDVPGVDAVAVGLDQEISDLKVSVNRADIMESARRFRE